MMLERHLRLEGTRNLRDVGGYPTRQGGRTRWRTLFRSDCLDRLSPAGQAWLVEQAGLRMVIDVRDATELAERPNVFAASPHLRYRHIPLFDTPLPPDSQPPPFDVGYWRILELCQPRIRAIIHTLVEPGGLPALIHCHAGKDRTGVVVAVILAAVGVQPSAIAADYALSAACLGQTYIDETRTWFASLGWSWEEYSQLAGSPAEVMLGVLEELDRRYGSVAGYLASIGVEAAALERLRALLTEGEGAADA
jgi:protein-tyrosine phosphatase